MTQVVLNAALANLEASGEGSHESDLYCLQGELLLQRRRAEGQAETCRRRHLQGASSRPGPCNWARPPA